MFACLTRISHRLTVEARERPAITSLRLLAVLTVLSKYASLSKWGSSSGARLVLTGLSRTSPRHVVRKAGWERTPHNAPEQPRGVFRECGVSRHEQIHENSAFVRLWGLNSFEQVSENSLFAAGGFAKCLAPNTG